MQDEDLRFKGIPQASGDDFLCGDLIEFELLIVRNSSIQDLGATTQNVILEMLNAVNHTLVCVLI